jgi:hypothetical protein
MTRWLSLCGLAISFGITGCRVKTPPARDGRCTTAQPLPLCTPEQAHAASTLKEFFQTAPRESARVRGRLVFGGATPEGTCRAGELRLAIGSGQKGEVVSTAGPLILLTEARFWTAPKTRAFEEVESVFRCPSREKGFCCAYNVAGQEVVATGVPLTPPSIEPTKRTDDFDVWWNRTRGTRGGGEGKDPCLGANSPFPYVLPWRPLPDEVAGLAVTSLCELPE